jgi:acyl-CoA synthetase (AMP-forming)/AMP-acid ligase II
VPGLLATRAQRQPDRIAIATAGGARLSFGERYSRSGRVAAALLERGVRRGDRVVLNFHGDLAQILRTSGTTGRPEGVDRADRARPVALQRRQQGHEKRTPRSARRGRSGVIRER